MTGPPLTILDAACGGSYLTLLLAWAFRHRWRYPATVIGIDQNSALLKKCAKHAALLGLDVRYQAARITDFAGPRADALVALHACDTASDDALALGVRMGAALIAVVPCCQAELAAQCESGPLASVWASPHLGRLVGSTLTDALRMLLLRAHGYDATAMEFVPTEHTPKNTLIRARKRRESDAGAEREYQQLKAALGGACIHLERMLGLSLPSAS